MSEIHKTLDAMWRFASGMVEKHGVNGDDTMTDAEHLAWQDASGDCNAIFNAQPTIIPLWERNDIQFPRLLSEILASQSLDMAALANSMDLDLADLNELCDRAQQAWASHKATMG